MTRAGSRRFPQWLAAVCLLAAVEARAADAATNATLTAEEQTWLAAHGTNLTVAFDPRWLTADPAAAPTDYAGIERDFVRLIENKLGIRFRVLDLRTWEDILAADKRGEIDVHPALRLAPDRQEAWLFTAPYIQIPVVLLVRKSEKESLTIDRMKTMRMAVGHKYAVGEFVAESYPEFRVQQTKSDLDALLDLSVGDLDIVVMDLATASYYVEKENITNLRIAGRVGPSYDFRMACRRDLPVLHRALEKALASISEAERKAIRDRWLRFEQAPFYRTRLFWSWVGGALAVVLVVFAAVLAWNKTLQRQVAETTRELRLELAERKRAEEALSRAHAELEKRVEERTRELAAANRSLEREVGERRQAEREVLEISSFERKRIGRDLHDSLNQQLAGISCLSETLATRLQTRGQAEAASASRISSLINDAIAHAKFIVRGLMPVEIVQEGLSHALRRLATETGEVSQVACRFECEEPSPVYNNDVATNLYRIAQEAVANAIRHGKPRTVTIRLTVDDLHGVLTVEDDGQGVNSADGKSGMGMRTMRYRAEMCGGDVRIAPREGGGTVVTCTFSDTEPEEPGEMG